MLPELQDDLEQDFEVGILPSLTYGLNFDTYRVQGQIDDREALLQAIDLALSVPRYQHEIYSWDYGSELQELLGVNPPLVYVKIKDTIVETLMQDDRIQSVDNFEFSRQGNKVTVKFAVTAKWGQEIIEREVIF